MKNIENIENPLYRRLVLVVIMIPLFVFGITFETTPTIKRISVEFIQAFKDAWVGE